MKREDVLQVLEANALTDKHPTYAFYAFGNGSKVGMFEPISETNLLRNAERISAVKYGTYRKFWPNLERYCLAWRLSDFPIVLFVLDTSKGGSK